MEEYIGVVKLFATYYAPRGWAQCNGAVLPIDRNAALFSILGTNFGGDGIKTFALPKLTSPEENLHYYICVEGLYPSHP